MFTNLKKSDSFLHTVYYHYHVSRQLDKYASFVQIVFESQKHVHQINSDDYNKKKSMTLYYFLIEYIFIQNAVSTDILYFMNCEAI